MKKITLAMGLEGYEEFDKHMKEIIKRKQFQQLPKDFKKNYAQLPSKEKIDELFKQIDETWSK